jgi:hypothetical protein
LHTPPTALFYLVDFIAVSLLSIMGVAGKLSTKAKEDEPSLVYQVGWTAAELSQEIQWGYITDWTG